MSAIVRFADPVVSGGRLPVEVSCTPRSGSLFLAGTTEVSCVATDACTGRCVVYHDGDRAGAATAGTIGSQLALAPLLSSDVRQKKRKGPV